MEASGAHAASGWQPLAEVSGHSTRVGAAQDLAELDIDLAAIMQAGGKSPRMPLQYAEDQCGKVRDGAGSSGLWARRICLGTEAVLT